MIKLLSEHGGPGGRFVTSSPGRVVSLFSTMYVLGALLVGLGISIPLLVTRLLLVAGIAVALLSLYGFHNWLFEVLESGTRETWIAVGGLATYLFGAAALFAASVLGSGSIALFGSWVAGIGLAVLTSVIRGLGSRFPGWWASGGFVLLVLSTVAVVQYLRTDWVLVLGTLMAILGLAIVSLGLLHLVEDSPQVWLGVGLAVVGTASASLVLLQLMAVEPLAMLPPAVLLVLGLVPLSNSVPNLVQESASWRVVTALLLGAGIGAVMTVSFSAADWPLVWALGTVALVVLFAAALVGKVVQLAVILVLGVVIAGVLVDRTDNKPVDPNPTANERLVVFGDSYISGEGATRFFPDTNAAGGDECRRTSSAYVYLLAEDMGLGLDSYACSGAKTFEVVTGAAGNLVSEGRSQLQQFLDDETERKENQSSGGTGPRGIAAVIVSIGGNDAWFGTVGQACLGPGTCDVHRNTLLRNVNDLGERIRNVFEGIRLALDERGYADTPIVAMPYPLVVTESGCDGSPLTRGEHQFLFEFTEVLDEQIRAQAAQTGVYYNHSAIAAFEGYRFCEDGEPAANVVDIAPKEGYLAARMLPTNWVHGSAHPNELGHSLTRDNSKEWLEGLLAALKRASEDPEVGIPDRYASGPRYARNAAPQTTRLSTRSLVFEDGLPCSSSSLALTVGAKPAILGSDVPYADLNVGSTVCYSQPDGEWLVSPPVGEDGTITIPGWEREVEVDFDANRSSTRQIVLRQTRGETWIVSVLEYCELDPNCADDEDEIRRWMVSQISSTAGSAVAPVLLMFTGAWFFAIDVKRTLTKVPQVDDEQTT